MFVILEFLSMCPFAGSHSAGQNARPGAGAGPGPGQRPAGHFDPPNGLWINPFPIQTLYNSNIVYAFAYVCSTTLHTTHIMSKKTCFRTLNDHLCYSWVFFWYCHIKVLVWTVGTLLTSSDFWSCPRDELNGDILSRNFWVRNTLVINALLKRIFLLEIVPKTFKLLTGNLHAGHFWLHVLFVPLLLMSSQQVALVPMFW